MLPVMSNGCAVMKSILIRNKIYFLGHERKDAPKCLNERQKMIGRLVVMMPARPVNVTMSEFFFRRGANIGDFDVEVKCLTSQR